MTLGLLYLVVRAAVDWLGLLTHPLPHLQGRGDPHFFVTSWRCCAGRSPDLDRS